MATTDQIVSIQKTGKYRIYINSARVDEDYGENVIAIKRPISTSKQNTVDAGVQYYSLKRFEHKFTINGTIEAQDYDSNGTDETAKEVKDYLYQNIFVTKNDIQLRWRSQKDYDYFPTDSLGNARNPADDFVKCYLQSVKFTDDSKRGQGSTNNYPLKYNITLVLVRGFSR